MDDPDVVHIFDTTLRDGEQSPGATMTVPEKVRVARQLDALGVSVIEAGFPAASPGDLEAVRSVARVVETSRVAGLARCTRGDIDAAAAAIEPARYPVIHVFVATSDIHLRYKLNQTREQVLERVAVSVTRACELCDTVEFSAEDATRSDWDYLSEICIVAARAGATVLNLPDTVGYTVPEEYGAMFRYTRERVAGALIPQPLLPGTGEGGTHQYDRAGWRNEVESGTRVPPTGPATFPSPLEGEGPGVRGGIPTFSAHCHNDLGLAVANTLAAVAAGARQVEVTINGLGERAGNAALEEVVMALRTRPGIFGSCTTQIRTEHLVPTSRLVSEVTGLTVQVNKAIVGANAFAHEAGIHQDGFIKERTTYEIMRPEDVGWESSRLVLGKHSGRHGMAHRLKQLGVRVDATDLDALYSRFVQLADRKQSVTDAELIALVDGSYVSPSPVPV